MVQETKQWKDMNEDDKKAATYLLRLFQDMIIVHGFPCYLLFEIKEDFIPRLRAVASDKVSMNLVLQQKKSEQRPDYMG